MKKILTTCCCVGVGLMVHGNAMATITNKLCIAEMCASDSQIANFVPRNCKTYWEFCYNGYKVYECTECNSGYTLQEALSPITVLGCSNTIDPMQCVEDCTGCSNCTSDTSWSAGNTGYEKKVTRTCNCNTCSATTSYRCAAGYYGGSTNGTSGCTSCKTATSNDNATSAAGSTAITSCYIPSETSMTDDSGTYEYTSDCYYSE